MGKGPGKFFSNKIIQQNEQEVALGKKTERDVCPKDKLKFHFFFGPWGVWSFMYYVLKSLHSWTLHLPFLSPGLIKRTLYSGFVKCSERKIKIKIIHKP